MAASRILTPVKLQARVHSDRTIANMRGRAQALAQNPYRRMYMHSENNEKMSTNEQFVRACESGDYSTVHRILEETTAFNIDATNQLGRTAMQLAIENEHFEVVSLLLEHCDGPKIREALLLAIYLGHIQIAEACLRHPTFRRLQDRHAFNGENAFWETPPSDDAQFSPDITPLILAAQHNRTEIVQLLLNGGDRINKPHDYHCKCQECHNRYEFDSLRHAQSRLNAYRGLASESYISLASIDRILTTFELGRELRDLSAKEKYFQSEYMTLANQLSAYAVKLLDKVRGQEELDCMLGKTGKEKEEKYLLLARLYLAIKYKEKPFVAHSNCQQKLVEIWHSEIRNLFKLNSLLIFLLTMLYVFVLPFACIVYIFMSWSKYSHRLHQFLKQPCIKFLGHTISYAIFIILIIVSSFTFANELRKPLQSLLKNHSNISASLERSLILKNELNDSSTCLIYPHKDLVFRADRLTWIDITLSVFVIGFLWHEVKQAYNDGLQDYLLSWNNIVDSCMNILYLSSFALKFYVVFKVIDATRTIDSPQFLPLVGNICNLTKSKQTEIYQTFYWLNADRFYWVSLDPINVAEGLFAIANIFSFSRICFLLPAFQHLGPLQISLGRMMSDIGKFIIIFLIIFCGFMFGLNNLFWYYQKAVRSLVEIPERASNDDLPAEKFFGSMVATFKTVFWSLFGLAEKDGIDLQGYNKNFTEVIGYLIYGLFNIASVIVLLNMLIAMMSKSYETIEEHADVEWKFARSKLYMEYIKQGGILPVPFNIIPTPKSIVYFFRRLSLYMKKFKYPATNQSPSNNSLSPIIDRPAHLNPRDIPTVSNGRLPSNEHYGVRHGSFDNNQQLTYVKLMERVIKRFLLHKQREEQEEIREGDFEELKQDIQMLRFEMLNRLDQTRDDLCKNMHLLNEGVVIVGELLSSVNNYSSPISRDTFHLFKKNFYSRTNSEIESSASTIMTTSMPSSSAPLDSALSTSSSTYQEQESDISPLDAVRHVAKLEARLSNIVEEDDKGSRRSLRFIDDEEEEIEGRDAAVQTTMPKDRTFSSKF